MIRNSTNKISIKPKVSNKAKFVAAAISVLTLLIVIYFSYQAGMRSGNDKLVQDAALIKQMNSTIVGLQSNIDASDEKIVFAERQQQIQAEAYKQMSNAYASAEEKNRYLGSRLDFYRSIISPEDGQSGPAIQELDYRQNNESNVAFDVTLVQAIRHKVHVTGNLSAQLYIDGALIDSWPEGGPRSINYQYFQQVSGVFESVSIADKTLENAEIVVKLNLHDGTLIERSFTIDPEQLTI